ncbi:hypothetical protein [Muribaculum intestinale]|uniref:hypothetical protein n=1 Tax=Muribaculum intestinale TaxID=1796646 RepID=UPI003F66215A
MDKGRKPHRPQHPQELSDIDQLLHSGAHRGGSRTPYRTQRTLRQRLLDPASATLQCEAPESIAIAEGVLTWSTVDNASGYAVFRNGEYLAHTTNNRYELNANDGASYTYARPTPTAVWVRHPSPLPAAHQVSTQSPARPVLYPPYTTTSRVCRSTPTPKAP